MIIVVDAYNIMHAVIKIDTKKVTEQQREWFIAQLGTYSKRKENAIVLVFDGGPHTWPSKENRHGVCVVYAGFQQTADDYIKKYFDEHRSYDLLLVSSDADLRMYARQYDIPVLESVQFWMIMQAAMQSSNNSGQKKYVSGGGAIKLTKTESDELDALMMAASEKIPLKYEDVQHDKTKFEKKRTASKQERKLLKMLKKL